MKLYLILAYTGDYYDSLDVYAVATSKEEAERLKKEAINYTGTCSDGSTWKWYVGVEIEEIAPNKKIEY